METGWDWIGCAVKERRSRRSSVNFVLLFVVSALFFPEFILKMSKRNVWSDEETLKLLEIMRENNILKLFDGKKFRSNEIYKKVEDLLKTSGFCDKTAEMVKNRWKNLKNAYQRAKCDNSTSGSGRVVCPFYDELDNILGCRESTTIVLTGVDTSRQEDCAHEVVAEDIEVTGDNSLGTSADKENPKKRQRINLRQNNKRSQTILQEEKQFQKEMQQNFFQ